VVYKPTNEMATPTVEPIALVHRYSFNEDGATSAVDSVGDKTSNGMLHNGAYIANGQLQLHGGGGGVWQNSPYVQLPANLFYIPSSSSSSSTSTSGAADGVSIEMWFSTSATGNDHFNRIFTFGDSPLGSGNEHNSLLVRAESDWGGLLVTISCDGGGYAGWRYVTGATRPYFAGLTDVHMALVLHSSGQQLMYMNGVLTMTATVPLELSTFTFNYLGATFYNNDASMLSGSIDEVRIWSTALQPYDILCHTVLGPDGKSNQNST
jgi:Concanavalin A-like lectin/glucanases superfamily